HRLRQLADAMLAETVVTIGGEMLQLGDEHLTELAERARHERDRGALARVLRHRGAIADRFVVGVCVDEQESPVGNCHTARLEATPTDDPDRLSNATAERDDRTA